MAFGRASPCWRSRVRHRLTLAAFTPERSPASRCARLYRSQNPNPKIQRKNLRHALPASIWDLAIERWWRAEWRELELAAERYRAQCHADRPCHGLHQIGCSNWRNQRSEGTADVPGLLNWDAPTCNIVGAFC